MKRAVFAVVLGCALSAFAARPARARGSWSVLTGRTLGMNRTVFWGQAGFPGISLEILHGSSQTLDIGGIFTFDYGVEGTTNIEPGLKGNFALRVQLIHKRKFSLGLEVDPGVAVYFTSGIGTVCTPGPFGQVVCSGGGGGTHFGPTIPVRLEAGIPVTPELNIGFGLDTGVTILVTGGTDVLVPILFGGGVEYFLSPKLALTFDLRMGPVVGTGGASFGLKSEIGLALPL